MELRSVLDGPAVIVFDTRFSLADIEYGSRTYDQGHIPGAFYLHLDRDLSSAITPESGRHPLPSINAFEETMRARGVSRDTQVIVYDDASGMFASRCWWLLKWSGHERVAVLDGGLPAWIQSGGILTTDASRPGCRGSFVAEPNSELLIDVSRLQSGMAEKKIVLVDARAPDRFRGDVEPIDKVAGHVPGAINRPFALNLDSDGRFKTAAQLKELHPQPQANERLVQMCGSGVTACHNILATAVSGQPLPALYAGSWSEWIVDPQRPVARG